MTPNFKRNVIISHFSVPKQIYVYTSERATDFFMYIVPTVGQNVNCLPQKTQFNSVPIFTMRWGWEIQQKIHFLW